MNPGAPAVVPVVGGPRHRRRQGRARRTVLAAVVVVALATAATVASTLGARRSADVRADVPTRPPVGVLVALPVWGLAGGTATITAHAGQLSGASPNLYEVLPDGGVALRAQPAGVDVPAELARLEQAGVPVTPTVSDTRDGSWDPAVVQGVLHDPALVAAHVRALVDLTVQHGFAGVDIDYEELTGADREAFSSFLARLADALHAVGRELTVDVFAKDTDAGYDERNLSQDYAAIGAVADQVRLMAYDWHWTTSAPGPIAPAEWVDRVLAYAVQEVPAEKVVLGVPTYGYDWGAEGGELVSWVQADGLARALGRPARWDPAAQSPWLSHPGDDGSARTVWFEDARSVGAKLALARHHGLGGVYLWVVGDEDRALWPVAAAYAAGEDR